MNKLLLTVLTAALTIGATFIHAQHAQAAPRIGREEWRDGATFGAATNYGSPCDTKRGTTQIDPGWIVIKYKVHKQSSYGRNSLNISYLQDKGSFYASSRDIGKLDTQIAVATQKGLTKYAADLKNIKKQYNQARIGIKTSHSALVYTAKACSKGTWYDQTGASLKGKIRILVRYIGTPSDVQKTLSLAQKSIQAGKPYGLICLKNTTGKNISYSYKWGNRNWRTSSVRAGANYMHWWNYRLGSQSSPNFTIRFNGGRSNISYSLKRHAASKTKCAAGKQYFFRQKSNVINLFSS